MQETLQQSSISLARSEEIASGITGRSMLEESQLEQAQGGDVDFDQLDREREAMEFEGLDDFLKGVEDSMKDSGADLNRIKSLEKSLEDEKRRLASMELQLRDAKKQRESEQQLVVVQKQSKVLANMFGQLTKATRSEVDQRQQWEAEWRTRFDDFNRQHREMEESLKRKHVSELKSLQDDIQKSIKRVALEFQKAKGQGAPSPRTMARISESNMERLVSLYHKHGQERLFLASKIARQEEVLVRSKNQSLQHFIVESQGNCNRLYRKFNLPTSKSLMKQIEAGQEPLGDMGTKGAYPHPKRKDRSETRGLKTRAPPQHARARSVASRMASTGPLPSPRINDGNVTFLTEIGGEEDVYSPPHQQARHDSGPSHMGFQPATAPSGSMAAMGRTAPDPLSHTLPAPSTQPRQPLPANNLSATYGSEALASDALSPEFSGWGKAAPPPQEGRPRWDNQTSVEPSMGATQASLGVPPPQWHPNIIAFEPSGVAASTVGGRGAKATSSPYLGLTGGLGGMPRTGKAVRRGTKGKGTAGNGRQRAGGAQTLPSGSGRSMSTQPRLEQTNPFGVSVGHAAPVGGMTLPHISDRQGMRVQANDANLSRPLTELATHDDLPSKEQKLHKLETWIEDKIRSVLGDEGSRASILGSAKFASMTAPSMDSRRGNARGKAPARAPSSSDGDAAAKASSWGRAESAEDSVGEEGAHATPVSALMGRLQASMDPGPRDEEAEAGEDAEPGEGNAGFVVQDTDERVRRRRREEERRKGREVEQSFEGTPVPAGGKTNRDGTHVELEESTEIEGRRQALDGISSRKSGKRVGWDLSDGEGMGYTTGGDTTDGEGLGSTRRSGSRPDTEGSSAVSGFLSRPETSASSFLGEPEPEEEGAGEGGGGGESPSRRSRRQRAEGGEPQAATQEAMKDLMSKVRHNKVPEVEEILARGFPIDQRDGHGNTPLMVAAQNGHKRLVKMSLRYGADPNASNHQGNTALHFATSYGYTALSKYLISKGADDTLINLKGLTCYDGIG